MEMQDKEFDELFRSKLEGFETEPSKAVWQNIAATLGEGKIKKRMAPFLSIAASIIVLIAAGILFITHNPAINKHQPLKNGTAKITRPSKVKAVANVNEKPGDHINQKKALLAVNQVTFWHHSKKALKKPPLSAERNIARKTAPVVTPGQTLPADGLAANKKNAVRSIPADSAVLVAVKPPIIAGHEHALLATALPVDDKPAPAPQVKKHRIRSFGDMLNVVIAAVDKRPDKIIEFSDTDGDESSITALNLGIIKIKKEN